MTQIDKLRRFVDGIERYPDLKTDIRSFIVHHPGESITPLLFVGPDADYRFVVHALQDLQEEGVIDGSWRNSLDPNSVMR